MRGITNILWMVLQRLSAVGQKLTKSENNDDVTSLRLDGCLVFCQF